MQLAYKHMLQNLAHMARRSVDWLIVISYALHNIFLALAIANDSSQVATYMHVRFGISPLWIMGLLMLGLVWSACLFIHWKRRIWGAYPLALVGITSIAVYIAENAIRAIIVISWVYFMCALIPIVLAVVQGNLDDARRENRLLLQRANELEQTTKQQAAKLIELEANFGQGKE